MYVDSVEGNARRRTCPRAAEQIDTVAARRNSSKNLAEMKLGASGLRIFRILPVDY
jgi:hypothetical protein